MADSPMRGRAGGSWAGGTVSDEDAFLLAFVVAGLIPAVLALIPSWRTAALHWLVARHVLVAASTHPLWTLPGDVGGLDARRLTAVTVCAGLLLICAASWGRWRYRRWIQHRLSTGDQS